MNDTERHALKETLRDLYEGADKRAYSFRYGMIGFDLFTVAFLIVSSFFPPSVWTETADVVVGIGILLDFGARMLISRNRWRDLVHPAGIADIVVIASLLSPIVGEGFAFLRVVRTLRLLRSYQLLIRLRGDYAFFKRNELTIFSAINLLIFIFVMTALVFETQHRANPAITNYADALYFTVTALTTTGFGDITLPGTWGRILSVAIMIFGVSLFLRLIQVLFRSPKVIYECPDCGLNRHDSDAVHCKHCGRVIHIGSEGST
jgi:voltage-gated potassium channel